MEQIIAGQSNKALIDRSKNHAITATHIGEGKKGLDVMQHALFDIDSLSPAKTVATTSLFNNKIEITGHGASVGDVVRFLDGNLKWEERQVVSVIDANNVETIPFSGLPQLGDELRIYRAMSLRVDENGNIQATAVATPIKYILDGIQVDVEKDTIVQANTRALPVEIHGASGVTFNLTAGDIGVQLRHDGANPDSVRLGDGTNIAGVNASNELLVKDADVEAAVASVEAAIGFAEDAVRDTETANVTRHSEIRGDLADIESDIESSNVLLTAISTNTAKTSNQEAYDLSGSQYKYVGEAAAGALTSAASWRIKRIEFLSGNPINSKWADGNLNFDNIWDNRAALSYS